MWRSNYRRDWYTESRAKSNLPNPKGFQFRVWDGGSPGNLLRMKDQLLGHSWVVWFSYVSQWSYPFLGLRDLDGIPGVVPGLVPGIQGCKSPGSLGKTWDQVKSLKFILIDSNFVLYPVLRPLVTLGVSPVFSKNFSVFKKIFFEGHPPGLPRGKGDGGCMRDPHVSPNYNKPVKETWSWRRVWMTHYVIYYRGT